MYLPQTDLTIAIINLLKKEGFLDSFNLGFPINNVVHIAVKLKYKGVKQFPIITAIKRISVPSSRIFYTVSKLESISGGVGVYILYTCIWFHQLFKYNLKSKIILIYVT